MVRAAAAQPAIMKTGKRQQQETIHELIRILYVHTITDDDIDETCS